MAIFFLCLDEPNPVGGIRVIYRHVDILSAHGIEAFVLHSEVGFKCTWFENNTPIAYGGRRTALVFDKAHWPIVRNLRVNIPSVIGSRLISKNDWLVFPEVYGKQINSFVGPARKVILNQSGFFTFLNHPLVKGGNGSPYLNKRLAGVITTSEWSTRYVQFAFPGTKVSAVPLSIDPELYKFSPNKKKQICYFPRKMRADSEQVRHFLKQRKRLNGFKIVPLDKMSDRKIAQVMQESLIFMSFGENEGFGLPAAEAMSCGCLVVGYHGMGGLEFFKKEFSHTIESGNVIKYVKTVERLIQQSKKQWNRLVSIGEAASRYITRHYSPEAERERLIKVWTQLTRSN